MDQHRVIKFNQKTWLRPHIEIRKKEKDNFEKYFSKLINNVAFWKNHGKCE